MSRRRLRRDKLTRRQQWELEDRRARSWQRKVMRSTRVAGPDSPLYASAQPEPEPPPLTAYRRRNGRHKADTGAAIVEAALVLPVLTLLVVGGLIYGAAMVTDLRLEYAAITAATMHEDDAAAVVETAGGTLTCYAAGEGPLDCIDDGATGYRVQVVVTGPTFTLPAYGSVETGARTVGTGPEGG